MQKENKKVKEEQAQKKREGTHKSERKRGF